LSTSHALLRDDLDVGRDLDRLPHHGRRFVVPADLGQRPGGHREDLGGVRQLLAQPVEDPDRLARPVQLQQRAGLEQPHVGVVAVDLEHPPYRDERLRVALRLGKEPDADLEQNRYVAELGAG